MKFPKHLFFIASLFLFQLNSLAQKESNNWYFGNTAGVTFSSGSPVAVTNGSMNAIEGCATISDSAGNLLFYTNGVSVWNRNHILMPNGNATLNGSNAATQNAIIVPKPNNSNIYYIFTVDADGGPNGLTYSEVTMSAAGGLGDVTSLNQPLLPGATMCEKITAVQHYNLRDYWVITHKWNSNEFDAFLVNPSGVNPVPVITLTGSSHSGVIENSHGYLKGSPAGNKIGLAITSNNALNTKAEVFDFDNSTGTLSNAISLTGFAYTVYGVEFSPDSRFFYVATSNDTANIHQFDLNAGSALQIVQSGQTPVAIHNGFVYALQLGLDEKIYGSQSFTTFLAAINNPDVAGSGCGFTSNAVSLAGRIAQGGLPNFIQHNFINADFSYQDTCFNNATNFTVQFDNPDSVRWDFGDPLSGNNSSTDTITTHVFSAPGNYNVTLIVHYRALVDTVIKTVQILPSPQVNFGIDTSMCEGQFINLDASSSGATSYLWQDNSTGNNFQVDTTGTYFVIATLNGCIGGDTINIIDNAIPVVNLGVDTILCESAAPYHLNAQNTGANYLWSNGSTSQMISVMQSGTYTVTVTVNGCSSSDDAAINISLTPNVFLGNDTTLCEGFQIFFNVTNDSSTYQWNDGYVASIRFVDTSGTYAVTVTNNHGCSAYDIVDIDLQFEPQVYLGEDTTLCTGQPIKLDATNYGATYQWQDGSTSATFNPIHTDIYGVSTTNQCGIAADSVRIDFRDCNCLVYLPKSFTPNSDNKNDVFNYEYDCNEFTVYMRIFNRIGQLMFYSEDPDIGWDGKYNGKPAEEGVYVYQLHYSGYGDGKLVERTERGTFLLMR